MKQEKKKVLSKRHKLFAVQFVKLGSTEKAALAAGYSKTYARARSYQLLENIGIKAYIDELTDKLAKSAIADADEVLKFLSSTMRGEVPDQFGLDPSLSDRLDAAKQLQKRYGLDKVPDEIKHTGSVGLHIEVDYGDDTDGKS